MIFVAGHKGLVGSAIVRRLGGKELVLRSRDELDLRDASAVRRFFERERPTHVYLAAAMVGGILANSTRPADFITDNLLIQTSVIGAAHETGVKKLLFLGSSCIYPRLAPQPIHEDALLTGPLEPTNSAYAIAKIAGIEMVKAYRAQHGMCAISAMPTNLYGPGDNFDLTSSHVLPALVRKLVEAKEKAEPSVTVWGTGTPRREFLHVDDLADACVFLMERYDDASPINVGTGQDLSIEELAEKVKDAVGYQGNIVFDTRKPDGTPRKLLDVSRLTALGWQAKTPLDDGIRATVGWYLDNR